VDARTLARLQALGRVVIGAGFALAPARTGGAWIGSAARRPGAQVTISAFGARDLAIGLGAAYAVGQGHGAVPWLRAGALADAADLAATLRAREHLPRLAVVAVSTLATGSALLGLWLSRELD